MTARYNITTWDITAQSFTADDSIEGVNVTLQGVRRALRTLRNMGYSCHRIRDECGRHLSDPSVLVERVADNRT
jgi:hypothetical protein